MFRGAQSRAAKLHETQCSQPWSKVPFARVERGLSRGNACCRPACVAGTAIDCCINHKLKKG